MRALNRRTRMALSWHGQPGVPSTRTDDPQPPCHSQRPRLDMSQIHRPQALTGDAGRNGLPSSRQRNLMVQVLRNAWLRALRERGDVITASRSPSTPTHSGTVCGLP